MTRVCSSARKYSSSSEALTSTALPMVTRPLKRRPRCWPRRMMSVPSPPLWQMTPTWPASSVTRRVKLTRARGEYTPRQFGPTTRTLASSAAASRSRCSASPSWVSPNPLDMTWATRTLPRPLRITPGTRSAAVAT
ncbi:Uncharacterised protein [Bordetella pertussis]|nr:Uncharacterised protein [Bordetella pertussis]